MASSKKERRRNVGLPKSNDSSQVFKTRKEIRVERFIMEELDRYIQLNKKHEKDLKYIG